MALARQNTSETRNPETETDTARPTACPESAPWGNAAAAEGLGACADTLDLPPTLAAAVRRHEQNRRRVRELLDDLGQRARSDEPEPTASDLAKNAAEWIDAGEVALYVLSPVDANSPHHSPGRVAYFDRDKTWREEPAYGDSGRGVVAETADVFGELDGDDLLLYDPLRVTQQGLESILVHEIQHDADEHDAGGSEGRPEHVPGEIECCPAELFDVYRSELRAYWIGAAGTRFGSEHDTDVQDVTIVATPSSAGSVRSHSATTRFSNRRQQDIFLHLCGPLRADGMWRVADEWASTYAWVPYYYVLDPAFRAVVDAAATPTSANATNSVRIEALRQAIAEGTDWRAVLVASPLDAQDRTFLADAASAAPFWDLAATRLGPAELSALRAAVA